MENLSAKFDSMRFGLERSIRYWSSRAVFWTTIVQAASIATAVTGSAAVASVFFCQWLSLAAAALAALCGILAASFDAPERVRFCTERIAQYTELLSRCPMADDGEKETPELLARIRVARLRIEAAEPILLECLDVICHNKVCEALGLTENKRRVTFFQRTVGRILPIAYKEKPA